MKNYLILYKQFQCFCQKYILSGLPIHFANVKINKTTFLLKLFLQIWFNFKIIKCISYYKINKRKMTDII